MRNGSSDIRSQGGTDWIGRSWPRRVCSEWQSQVPLVGSLVLGLSLIPLGSPACGEPRVASMRPAALGPPRGVDDGPADPVDAAPARLRWR